MSASARESNGLSALAPANGASSLGTYLVDRRGPQPDEASESAGCAGSNPREKGAEANAIWPSWGEEE